MSYRNREKILDFPEEYPNAAVVIQCFETNIGEIDYKWLMSMAPQFPKGYCVGFLTEDTLKVARELDISAYLMRYINTYAELNELHRIGVSYVMLGQPLFSSLDKVKLFHTPIRWSPNVVNNSNFNLNYLEHGTWIRPEDLHLYDINVVTGECVTEFPGAIDYKAEQSLYRIYKKGTWPQDLGFLLPEFKGYNINNFLIPDDFCQKRLNCHQQCEEKPDNSMCHYCVTSFKLANTDFLNTVIKSSN